MNYAERNEFAEVSTFGTPPERASWQTVACKNTHQSLLTEDCSLRWDEIKPPSNQTKDLMIAKQVMMFY
ncbi:MAG: hypothetical protein JSV51_03625 [Candidatus Bathyarchaeota archaeon]|nr:MAG: hypothetical protein JSV51_03625 [Candidatus Bathyarchaeota archaeon]